ncbi:TRAP transporter small permease [Arthrobacter castelli]|uniref:TRAP transporter small permease n=1 Tax=Arthrobacter castelli TaxID=271431 RepID=UPI000407163F|nr:TRAP transporter small permease [Arthrobacter castelli]
MESSKKLLDRTLEVICVVLFAALVLVVVWQVFTRQVLDQPSSWSSTLARYIFVWLGLGGAALVFGERGHIAVDFVVRKLPDSLEKAIAVLVQVIIAVFSAIILVWGGYRVALQSWEQALSGLPLSVGPLYLAMPVAGVLIIIYALYHSIEVLRRHEPPVAHDEPEAV